jgi:hypothetical protein
VSNLEYHKDVPTLGDQKMSPSNCNEHNLRDTGTLVNYDESNSRSHGLVPPYSPAAHSYGQQYPYQGWPLHAPYFPAPPMAPPYTDSGMARPMPAPAPKHKSPATPARAPHTRKSFVNDQREPGGKSALVYVQENHLSDLPFQSGSLRQMLPQARQNACSRHTVPWSGASSRRKS